MSQNSAEFTGQLPAFCPCGGHHRRPGPQCPQMPVARTPDHSSITSVIISFWISFSRVELMRGHQRPIVQVHGPVCPPAWVRTGIPPARCMELPFWAEYGLTVLGPKWQPHRRMPGNGHPGLSTRKIIVLVPVRTNTHGQQKGTYTTMLHKARINSWKSRG